MKQRPEQFCEDLYMQPQRGSAFARTVLPVQRLASSAGNYQDDFSARPSLPGNPISAFRQPQADPAISTDHANVRPQSIDGSAQDQYDDFAETVSIDDISSEMHGLQCRFVQDVVVGDGSEGRHFANTSLARIENWNGTAADALVDGVSVSKLVIKPEFPVLASLRVYTLPLNSQRTAVARNAQRLNDWLTHEGEYRRNHHIWEAERRRLEDLLTRRMVTYSRMWVKQMMYNRFDTAIDHWCRHYNDLLHPAEDLDPNIVKSIIYQESRMGTAGRHLMPPPSDWTSAERHPIRSRFNLAQAIDSWGPQQWLMMQEMAPALFSRHHLDALESGRRWMGMRNTEYAHHATFMTALREFFQHRDAAGNNFMGTPGRDLHEDYAFWIRTAIRWLFVKYQSLTSPNWREAVRAYNGSGESARRYRDAVMARVGDSDAYAAETSDAWITPGVSLTRAIGALSLPQCDSQQNAYESEISLVDHSEVLEQAHAVPLGSSGDVNKTRWRDPVAYNYRMAHPVLELIEATPRPPRYVVLLDHHVKPSVVSGTGASATWLRSGSAVRLTPSRMQPGYSTSATALQSALNTLMTQAPYASVSQRGGRLAVALVDLTGSRIVAPHFAAFQPDKSFYAASLAKIVPLYAAQQLRTDLEHAAGQTTGLVRATVERGWRTKGVGRWDLPLIQSIFDGIGSASSSTIPTTPHFSSAFKNLLLNIVQNSNRAASRTIELLGYRYMASLIWQAGLHDRTHGGLWCASRFGGSGAWRGRYRRNWQQRFIGSPRGKQYHDVTARSAANYFTLLAQNRLLDATGTTRLLSLLSRATTWFKGWLTTAHRTPSKVYAKVGLYSSRKNGIRVAHEAALIERTAGSKRLRYVAVILTQNPYARGHANYMDSLITALDELIVRNNP